VRILKFGYENGEKIMFVEEKHNIPVVLPKAFQNRMRIFLLVNLLSNP
jgi:hypothetical protein